MEFRMGRIPIALRQTLGDALNSGVWDRRYGEWRTKPHFEGSLRLIVSMLPDREQ